MVKQRRGILQEGRFGWAGRSGMVLSEGVFWCRRAGGYNFYLGRQGWSAIDFEHPVGASGPAELSMRIKNVFSEPRDYWTAVKSVSRFGLESDDFAWLRVRMTDSGVGHAVPDQIRNLRAGFTLNGTVKLEWEYEPRIGTVRPSVFKIYLGFEDQEVQYEYPLETVAYREGRRNYTWESFSLWGAVQYKLAVRAETAQGVDDGCQRSIIARADAGSPGEPERLWMEQI